MIKKIPKKIKLKPGTLFSGKPVPLSSLCAVFLNKCYL